jgi:hypothetical protein
MSSPSVNTRFAKKTKNSAPRRQDLDACATLAAAAGIFKLRGFPECSIQALLPSENNERRESATRARKWPR